jgi:hypothetical protein
MKKSIRITIVLFAILLSACQSEPEEPTPTASETASVVMLTAGAETMIAQLTHSVMDDWTATPTSPPPMATSTATLPPPTPTGPTQTPSETLPPTETSPPTGTIAPTGTPTSTQTPLPTLTPSLTNTPIPTLGPDDPKLELGEPDWQADFTEDTDWYFFNEAFGRFQLDSGQLLMTAKKTESMEFWSLSWPYLSDFYLEFKAITGRACDGKDRYGMVLRAPDTEAGYLFGASCEGEYSLRYWDSEDIAFAELVPWTASNYINSGPNQINYLGVKAQGNRLILYINGHLIHEIQDQTQLEGKFGSFIKAENTPGFQVRIANVAYWELME